MTAAFPTPYLVENLARGFLCSIIPANATINPIIHIDGDTPRLVEVNSRINPWPPELPHARLIINGSFRRSELYNNHEAVRNFFEVNFSSVISNNNFCGKLALISELNKEVYPTEKMISELIKVEEIPEWTVALPTDMFVHKKRFTDAGFSCEVMSSIEILSYSLQSSSLILTRNELHWWASVISNAQDIRVWPEDLTRRLCAPCRSPQVGVPNLKIKGTYI